MMFESKLLNILFKNSNNLNVVGYCEYFAFYIYEHTHETQTARDTCKFPLPSLYVSGNVCRAAAGDALLAPALSSLVRRTGIISHMARGSAVTPIN